MTPLVFHDYRLAHWRGLVHPDWAATFAQHDPLAWMASLPHEQTRHRIARQIYRVQSPDGVVYLKVILGLNAASVNKQGSLLDHLKWRWRPSRAIQTLKVSQAMLDHGLLCPLPILAAREHAGRATRDVFLSQAIDLPGLGVRLQQAADNPARIAMVQAVAPHIARLHQLRFLHGDLLPNNLHVNESLTQVYFMDNDRTRRWPIKLPMWAIRRNLAQLAYRLYYHQGEEVTRAFLLAYAQAMQWSPAHLARESTLILKSAQERIEKYKANPTLPQ